MGCWDLNERPEFSITPSEPTQVLPPRPPAGSGAVVTVGRDRHPYRFIKWLVALVVIALLAVVAAIVDQTFRARAEKDIAATIAKSIGANASTVGVTIHNLPFLGVLVTDELQGIDTTISKATVDRDDTTVTFRDVDIHANGIRHAREESQAVAETMSATGRIDWSELSRLAGGKVTYNDDTGETGRVAIVTVLGARVDVSITAVPGVKTTSRRVTLSSPSASLDDIPIPDVLLKPILDGITSRFTLPDLGNLHYESLKATSQGLDFSLVGTGVKLSDLTGR
ncbi:DUF2993 domain-containing protein [Propionibacterium sp. NM47_B9-13]|jgi:hypothetical protein|nr:DUF2993 domain-containing protein [Cutibacterium modestum]EFS74311.1 hypothetical protein HMPREF9621_01230 [Cutibacterium modestum HL037PA2]EFT16203.1 hypothetical protein HMPREF9622_00657 [Cutibacterium modestum HL037PA3]TGY27959.1 DUF2993 domain-containing protein [Propionibacterium sp. NM47_B9-13]AOH46355.1 hypothetical protein BCB70_11075 [Cutibacterium modestum]REB74463.1 DUF2993 domain-containing protein [Cutibacterium modestum]